MTPDEISRLWVPLQSLPEFDPAGLWIYSSHGTGRICLEYKPDESIIQLGPPHEGWCVGSDHGVVSLADSSTADRVARWLAKICEVPIDATAPIWRHVTRRSFALQPWEHVADFSNPRRRQVHFIPPLATTRRTIIHGGVKLQEFEVPAFAEIDSSDERLLPDGSMFVDRLALAMVAIHVGKG